MSSLRTIHLVFVLIVFIAADMFGAWGVWSYQQTQEGLRLVAGLLSFLFGFGVVGYTIWLVHKLDKAHVE